MAWAVLPLQLLVAVLPLQLLVAVLPLQLLVAVLPLQLLVAVLLLLLLLLPHRCPARTVPDRQQSLAMAAVQLPMLPP
jgi:hypothetical protein